METPAYMIKINMETQSVEPTKKRCKQPYFIVGDIRKL